MPNIERIPADAPPAPDPKSASQLRNAVIQKEKEVDKMKAERQKLRQVRDWKAWEKTHEPFQKALDELEELAKTLGRATAAEEAGETAVSVGTAKESNK